MSRQAIEEFGEHLVRYVRDWVMPQCDMLQRPDDQGASAERWRAAAAAGGRALASMLIPECVDTVIGCALYAMDDASLLHLLFTTPRGETVDLSKDGHGELSGSYGARGWRMFYSKERIMDAAEWVDFGASMAAKYGFDPTPDPAPVQAELPMPRRAIEELGELLVRHVRDVAIRSCDAQLTPQSDTPVAKRWRQAALESGGAVPPEMLIPDCVDETLLAFLRAIDAGLLPLSYTAASGETVSLQEAGEGKLAERYPGKEGWRARYTKARFIDEITNRALE